MIFLNFLKNKKKRKISEELKLHNKYVKNFPKLSDYLSTTYYEKSSGRYDDSYKTEEGLALRELLLLVWWGKIKKGRTITCAKPKYFIYDYGLNIDEVTKKLVSLELLIVHNNIMHYTDKGKKLSDKYQSLWSIHSFKSGTITNLDRDFEKWDENKFFIKQNQGFIKAKKEQIKYIDAYIKYLKSNPLPKSSPYYRDNSEIIRYKEMHKDQIEVEINILIQQNKKLE